MAVSRDAGQKARASAAVPAQPIELDPIAGGRCGTDVQVDRLARKHAHLAGEALDSLVGLGRRSSDHEREPARRFSFWTGFAA